MNVAFSYDGITHCCKCALAEADESGMPALFFKAASVLAAHKSDTCGHCQGPLNGPANIEAGEQILKYTKD